MKALIFVFSCLVSMNNVYADNSQSESAILFAKQLVKDSVNGIEKLYVLGDFDFSNGNGYAMLEGWYSPRNRARHGFLDREVEKYCATKSGAILSQKDGKFCILHLGPEESVLFYFNLKTREKIGVNGNEETHLTIVEPNLEALDGFTRVTGYMPYKRRMQLEQENQAAEEKRQDRLLAERAEAERIAKLRSEQELKSREDYIKYLSVFRDKLKEGDQVKYLLNHNLYCNGMVIEVRRPLALVQLDNCMENSTSTRWKNISELDPRS